MDVEEVCLLQSISLVVVVAPNQFSRGVVVEFQEACGKGRRCPLAEGGEVGGVGAAVEEMVCVMRSYIALRAYVWDGIVEPVADR